MPLYVYVHDSHWFQDRFLPTLASCRSRRSFGPCLTLCSSLGTQVQAERWKLGDEPPFFTSLHERSPFDLQLWRHLAGELLLFGAVDLPVLPQAADTLCRLLAPQADRDENTPRRQGAPIHQAHFGTRELCFGPTFYRPENVGWNDVTDVARIACWLASVDPSRWTLEAMRGALPERDPEECADELEFARECFRDLSQVYAAAARQGHVIVIETFD